MTSTTSLFACAAADVTLDRIRVLVEQNQPESLTLEYKEKFTSNLVTSVAAMANSYGGLILVGVTDQPQPDRLVGVAEHTLTQIVNGCHESLEPPWQPEIIVLPLPSRADRHLLVIRVHAGSAPRPILIRGAAPVRLHGRNATADRARLAHLFHDVAPQNRSATPLPAPQLASAHSRMDALFILRSGLRSPVDDAAAWRPLSERGLRDLSNALDASPIVQTMRGWSRELDLAENGPFQPRGLNRARRARLVKSNLADLVDVVLELQLPEVYGARGSDLTLTLDVVAGTEVQRRPTVVTAPSQNNEERPWRLSVLRLRALVTALLATLVDRAVVEAVAGLARIDSVVVPQPPGLALRSKPDAKDLLELDGLTPMTDRGTSHGADMIANPALDLREPQERQEQVNDWLAQIGLDAGLLGMQRLLDQPDLPPDLR